MRRTAPASNLKDVPGAPRNHKGFLVDNSQPSSVKVIRHVGDNALAFNSSRVNAEAAEVAVNELGVIHL